MKFPQALLSVILRIRGKRIALKPSLSCRRSRTDPRRDRCYLPWATAPAFAVNPRGVLTHRVRHVTTLRLDWVKTRDRLSHHHVDYLCNNGCNVDLDDIEEVLTANPPKDRLLCQACEDMAASQDLPSADQLAGRHVHRGVLVPRQTCCQPEEKRK